ncbi:MAG: hypothetical protein AAF298_08740 [Cyanobacteria bacterium P01_A01_bin.40]
MIFDTYKAVFWGIARNPNSSPQLLIKLLDIHEDKVAGAIAERKEILPEGKERLRKIQ